MGKRIDLVGQKFGRLTVLEDVGRNKQGRILWRCQCDCGIIINVGAGQLQSKHTQSCGCYNKDRITETQRIDLTGKVFGRLTVLEEAGRRNGRVLWKCQCSCGNIVEVVAESLQNGRTQSCGCLQKERVSETHYQNLTGQVFGRLTALEDVGRKHGGVLWRCICECGNTVDVRSGDLQKGYTQSCGCLQKERISETHSGERSHFWRGGITPLSHAIRSCTFSKEWRNLVFVRDDYTCQHCSKRGVHLHAHHIRFFSTLMENYNIITLAEALQCEPFWDIDNGVTLCKKCHKKEHARLKTVEKNSILSI